jgi:hypothetical protein
MASVLKFKPWAWEAAVRTARAPVTSGINGARAFGATELGGDLIARDLWWQPELLKTSPARLVVGPHSAEMMSIAAAKP